MMMSGDQVTTLIALCSVSQLSSVSADKWSMCNSMVTPSQVQHGAYVVINKFATQGHVVSSCKLTSFYQFRHALHCPIYCLNHIYISHTLDLDNLFIFIAFQYLLDVFIY